MAIIEDAQNRVWALGDKHSWQYLHQGHAVAEFDGAGTWNVSKVERVKESSPPSTYSVYVTQEHEESDREILFEPQGAWLYEAAAAPPGTKCYKIPMISPANIPTTRKLVTFGHRYQDTSGWQMARFESFDSDSKVVSVWLERKLNLEEISMEPFLLQIETPVGSPTASSTLSANPSSGHRLASQPAKRAWSSLDDDEAPKQSGESD